MFESRMTWEKLKLELDLLGTESPTSLLPLIFGTNSFLLPSESFTKLFQQLSFMNFEAANFCKAISEEERIHSLNQFFFNQLNFSIQIPSGSEGDIQTLLIPDFFETRQGHPLLVGLTYTHFAAQLDLPIYLTSTHMPHILKWVRGEKKTTFIDMTSGGQHLKLDQILELYNNPTNPAVSDPLSFEILPSRTVLTCYLELLLDYFDPKLCAFSEVDILNILISLRPSHLKYLARRALVYKEQGQFKLALQDFKRYFSFIDRNSAAPELKMAFYEVQALCTLPHEDFRTFH
ncbi:MAG: hypothetical protein KDD61_15390 [Bdellovibrionales bacterium]|nr:hypothetical protein [Bdellovibrionales bacterium]